MQNMTDQSSEMSIINVITILASALIVLAFVYTWYYVSSKDDIQIKKNRQWIEQLPSLLSTFGVFGTFVGITVGLYFFKPDSLETSITELLSGLKTAFITSLLGMACSIILNRKISHRFDSLGDGKTEMEIATKAVVDAINELKKSNEDKSNDSLKTVKDMAEDLKLVSQGVEQIRDDVEEIKGSHELIRETQSEILDSLNRISNNESVAEEVRKLKAVAMTATASIATMDNAVSDLNNSSKSISKKLDQITDYVEEEKENKG